MTQYLAENAREVMAVEIDKNLIPILSDTLSAYDNVSILNADILKVDIAKIVEEKNGGKPVKVVANLPYYITTPIIMGLFESHVPIDSILSWYRKKLQTVCSQVREQKTMVHYHSQCSTMQNHMWQRMCRQTALCQDQKLDLQSSVLRNTKTHRSRLQMRNYYSS